MLAECGFEVVGLDPAGQPWLNWNRETTYVIRRESADAGVFESWLEVTRVDGDLVRTRRTLRFRG